MNAFTLAAQMLGGGELSPGQVAQLRAIDHEYNQRLFSHRHVQPGSGGTGIVPEAPSAPDERELASLHARLVADVRSILGLGPALGAIAGHLDAPADGKR